jgi:hypothetical protein
VLTEELVLISDVQPLGVSQPSAFGVPVLTADRWAIRRFPAAKPVGFVIVREFPDVTSSHAVVETD